MRPLGLGILGFGVAGRALALAADTHHDVELVAVADPALTEAVVQLGERAVPVRQGVDELCADQSVEAIYVATPTEHHRDHVLASLAAGHATIVEKPMAATIDDADAMVAAADASERILLVGHSHSYEAPVRAMRRLIRSGRIGCVQVVTALNGTDWMYRPRRPSDLDVARGGGVTLRQGAHHFDVVRYLLGGHARSVQARVGRWDPDRGPSPGVAADGAYAAFLEFEDGAVATVTYNGYDRFPATELTGGVTETGQRAMSEPGSARREVMTLDRTEEEELQRRPGNRRDLLSQPGDLPPTFGFLLVSGTAGDLRVTPRGLTVYGSDGAEHIVLTDRADGRRALLDELVAAERGARPPIHSGHWGRATLEVCLAVLESAQTGTMVHLQRQAELPDGT